ncbi:NUDIX hydrolase N-terminal domain-containing protein [Weissella koreensis]|uniref:NUDIX hydrolase N-terminal domain-containing protein n=1 Tax=Weissella koreensis TaxID=165096 RepID=UPI0022BA4B39|nr:NUDIX hydrolase N-terminal domain-containing protein [Weissella koreensis]MCZ9311552.1 NUDIX hydrolase N-terminal domain-containing protein [Weissella koreensis]
MVDFDELKRVRRILTIARTGLAYTKDTFDRERLREIEKISISLLAQISHYTIDEIKQQIILEPGYITPKIDVRVFIQNDQQKVLLVQDIKTKQWSLPGGFAEVGMSPIENAQREVLEETGVNAEIINLKGVFDTDQSKLGKQLTQYYKLIFEGKIIDEGTFKSNYETSDVCYFSLDQLPELSLPRTTAEQIFKISEMIKRNRVYIE